jgi:predicted nucleic acid-binding protein
MQKRCCAQSWPGDVRIKALADTGALLALLDRNDRWHTACVDTFPRLHLPLITSTAILTELFHLVGGNEHEVRATWAFIRSGAVSIHPIHDSDLPELDRLMDKYSDRPMDFADATLVLLARKQSINTIFTVDFNDFEIYRIERQKRFRILPGRSA